MDEKSYEHLMDAMGDDTQLSNCCGARVYLLGESAVCTQCQEHCDIVTEE